VSKTSEAAQAGIAARAVRYLIRQGWRRGVVGGSPAWTAVCGLGLLGYLAGRAWHREPDVVFSEKLAPGEVFRISLREPPLT
jgi:hypothetical protein